MRPRLGFSFNRKSFFAKAQNPQWWHAPWPPARAVALHEVRVEAGWLLPPGGGWVPWWVPWCLGKVSFNTPEFVGVPFFLVAPQKNGKFRCFFVTLVTAWFFCWLISINQHIDDALPSRRPRGSGPALWVFCRISMDFQSQDMTTSIIIINPSQTHPPPPAANGDSWANWAFTLAAYSSASKATSGWRLRLPLHGQNHGPNPQGLIWTYSYQQPFLPAGAHRAVPQPQSAVASTSE